MLPAFALGAVAVGACSGAGAASTANSGAALEQATAVTAGIEHNCALTGSGALRCWGYNGHCELCSAAEGLNGGVQVVSAGWRHSCAVTSVDGAMCWGVNYGGASGDGTGVEHGHPVHVLGLSSGVRTVSAGYDRACALLSAGGVKCWGTDYGLAPIDIPGLNSGVLAISVRGSIGCAITTAREVKCWGAHYGSTPDIVPGLNGVNALTTGFPLCALTGSGGVKCWGSDSGWTPVDVPELTSGVRAIDTSAGHGCALMSTGGVKCWGSNDHGQLGDGTTADRATPVDVAGLRSGAIGIATGFVHSCAVLGSGGIKCWGANGSGQLGDGTLVERHRPVSVFGFGPPARCIVPNVVGKRLARARVAVARGHCRVGIVAHVASAKSKNVVVGQSPRPGKRLKAGFRVKLSVSRGR